VCFFQHTGDHGKKITVHIGTVFNAAGEYFLGAFALHIEAVHQNAL
jgi:hypothetical protein